MDLRRAAGLSVGELFYQTVMLEIRRVAVDVKGRFNLAHSSLPR